MRTLRLVLILVVLVALQPIAAHSILSHNHNDASHHPAHEAALIPAASHTSGHDDHSAAAVHDHAALTHDHDADARNDMHAFAVRHFGATEEHPETLNGSVHPDGQWELRWMDVDHGNETVRLYHITHTHDHELRYVAAWDAQHGHYGAWEPVH